jgi:hypothetical protein
MIILESLTYNHSFERDCRLFGHRAVDCSWQPAAGLFSVIRLGYFEISKWEELPLVITEQFGLVLLQQAIVSVEVMDRLMLCFTAARF